jgi:hypothetical protein
MKIYTGKNRTLARQKKLEGTIYKSDIGFTLISEITTYSLSTIHTTDSRF